MALFEDVIAAHFFFLLSHGPPFDSLVCEVASASRFPHHLKPLLELPFLSPQSSNTENMYGDATRDQNQNNPDEENVNYKSNGKQYGDPQKGDGQEFYP